MSELHATVVGAGLAGCEAAWQLAQQGIRVTLIEMKPDKMSPAHHSPLFAELVCSNSLRSDRLTNAVGLLKEEMRLCDSLIMAAADAARVPAGGALAVDRDEFSGYITKTLTEHPLVTIENREVTEIPDGPVIIATGPLTSDSMSDAIAKLPGLDTLNFYDAAAPIVTLESLNMERVFLQSRYGSGVRVMRVGEGDRVVTVARTERDEEAEAVKPEDEGEDEPIDEAALAAAEEAEAAGETEEPDEEE